MVAKGEFTVRVSKKEVVAAVLPLQEYWLPLSNLDFLLPAVDVGVFFCYKKPAADGGDDDHSEFGRMVEVLKKAMAEALVSYYALAGEVVYNYVGEPELLCNNRGVDFVEAYANVDLKDLNLYNPDESIQGKVVPTKKNGVLSVQATELKCGGLVVGCTFDHRIADAYSVNMFLVSWAEIAMSRNNTIKKPISSVVPQQLPSFRRSVLNPRRPIRIDHTLDDMYVPISSLPPAYPPSDQIISRIYHIKSEKLNELQLLATIPGCRRMTTKLESFSAFLWKMVAVSTVSVANCHEKDHHDGNDIIKSNYNKFCKMGIVVDGRTRLGSNNNSTSSAVTTTATDHHHHNKSSFISMDSYFGNVLSIPFGGQKVKELIEKPLSWVAEQVHDFLEDAVTKDHFLGLIDWVEARRPEPVVSKIYSSRSDDGPAFVISSGQRFPVSKVDFGWGKPAFGSYHFPWGGHAGYVMPMPSPSANGDWVVYIHLPQKQLDFIEAHASHIFTPLTFDYLSSE